MYKRNNIGQKVKIILLIVIAVNMALALGILIGQRNDYNLSKVGALEISTESGKVKNFFTKVRTIKIEGLQDKPIEAGEIKYLDEEIVQYQINIKANYIDIRFGKEKKELPTKLSIFHLSFNKDLTNLKEEKIGEIELEKKEGGTKGVHFGQFKNDPLQVNKIVIKPENKEDVQNFYLLNDKNYPESLNNTSMPYFWASIN
jgi:hypothetical protein